MPVRVWPRAPLRVNKIILIFFIIIFTSSCSEISKEEKYIKNCVKDGMKLKGMEEYLTVKACELAKKQNPDVFNYYEGKIFSIKR